MSIFKSLRTLGAGCAVGAFVVTTGAGLSPAMASDAQSDGGTSSNTSTATVADLADSSAAQQRWISEPDSRIALNPSHSQSNDAKPKANDSLDTVFYADQEKVQESNIISNQFGNRENTAVSLTSRYDEGDAAPALSDAFTPQTLSLWKSTDNGGRITGGPGGGIVSSSDGKSWGGVGREVTLDVAKTPILLIAVASTQGKWSVKINNGDGDIRLQDDTSATGVFTYDMAGKVQPGTKNITVKLFSADNGDTVFTALSIHHRPEFEDNFNADSLSKWSTQVQSNNGATIAPSPTGLGATVTSSSTAGFGAVSRPVTVDLTKNPILTIAISSLSKGSMWALKLTGSDGSGDFANIQLDTDTTGIRSYNIQAITGKTGEQTFGVKLFSTKSPTPTSVTFTRLSFHNNANSVFQTPSSYVNTWNPQSLDWSGVFGDTGSYATQDVFVDNNTVARLVNPSSLKDGNPVLTGSFSGQARWDASTHVLTSAVNNRYSRSTAFPDGASVSFFKSADDATSGDQGASEPSQDDRIWVAVLPRDQRSAIAFGYAYGTDATAQSDCAQYSLKGTSTETVLSALSARTQEWNAYLAKVPSVSNYSLHLADTRGISSTDIRAMYYRAFVNLRQTVIPPQPESGISHHQVATGKAATYNGGSSRNRASASWDSLLGIQYLAYTEPDIAWDSYLGMMTDVGEDGNLNGESLPSRKAQTAWMLYTTTGNLENLRSVYPTLRNNLVWSSNHLAWNISSHYPGHGVSADQERDAEFVVSLSTDLSSAINIAKTLHNQHDVDTYEDLQRTLSNDFKQWFFIGGKAVQYFWENVPNASYEQRAGTAQYVATGLHMPGLGPSEVAAMMARFNEEYDPDSQFAGLASDALKAPDAQFVAYGLLEQGQTEQARVFLESVLRDVTSTHAFSEVYQAGNPTISRGESPTTFGMAQVIDNVWILNGLRSDAGTPTFVRLYGSGVQASQPQSRSLQTQAKDSRGVAGLTYLGKQLNVETDDSGITISGDATTAAGTCTRYTPELGVSVPIAFTCGTISLPSGNVHAGDAVQIKGGNYTPNSIVALESDGKSIASAQSDAHGNVSIPVTFATKDVGNHVLTLRCGDITAAAALTVLAARDGSITPTPTPTPKGPKSPANPGPHVRNETTGLSNTAHLASTGTSIALILAAILTLAVAGVGSRLAFTRFRKGR